MVPGSSEAGSMVTMTSAVLETRHDSWKVRAFQAFGVPILSRPHTLPEVEEGQYSCRVLFSGLGKDAVKRIEQFLANEVKNGALIKTVSLDVLTGGIQVVVVGEGPSVEGVLDGVQYIAPRVMLEGSIISARDKERFMASFMSEHLLHYLMGDLAKFSQVRLLSIGVEKVVPDDLFPPALKPLRQSIADEDFAVLLEALSSGYFDDGPRKTTQEAMAAKLGVSKRTLNARLRRLERIGIAHLLSPKPPTEELLDSLVEDLAREEKEAGPPRFVSLDDPKSKETAIDYEETKHV